ncbi:hypothetical protein ANTRET_LOCUS9979 [Anthophora retusa]
MQKEPVKAEGDLGLSGPVVAVYESYWPAKSQVILSTRYNNSRNNGDVWNRAIIIVIALLPRAFPRSLIETHNRRYIATATNLLTSRRNTPHLNAYVHLCTAAQKYTRPGTPILAPSSLLSYSACTRPSNSAKLFEVTTQRIPSSDPLNHTPLTG